ncbi:MAG: hypothetical protein FJ041_01450 [Candidatus Cloacimonetes bacterium]|nr:hypothetical protein [Candidatus Cloacimonadota bacterium]
MKQTPLEDKITARMQPGVITLSGFLGNDDRHYHAIIEEDEKTLSALGKTADEIANRLEYFTDASFNSFMEPVVIDEIYEVETEVTRGKLPCPFNHPGIYRKTVSTLTNLKTGVTLRWSFLNIHLIREHHFFEGKGSTFRLEPDILVKNIF